MRDLRTFLIASSLLAAVLLVWAQLWERAPEGAESYAVGLGLSWTLLSVLLTLFAMAWAGFASLREREDDNSKRVPNLSISLFGASIVMTIYNVGQSCLSIMAQTASGKDISQSMIVPLVGGEERLPVFGMFLAIVLIVLIGLSIWSSKGHESWWPLSISSLTLLILIAASYFSVDALKIPDRPQATRDYLHFVLLMLIPAAIVDFVLIIYFFRLKKPRFPRPRKRGRKGVPQSSASPLNT